MPEKRPTILQIIPDLDTGGAERTTVEMAEAIVKAGGRAIVLTEGGRMCAEVECAGGEVLIFPAASKNPLRVLSNASAIASLIRRENIDLVHARSRAPAWSALIAARRTGARFLTTYHGIYNESGRIKRAYNSVMARGDIVIANSNYTARIVRERYGIEESRIAVVNRGVDIARFDRAGIAPQRLDALRTAWQLVPGQRVVLHPARLTRWKGQSVVIAAAAHLAADPAFADVVIILAGDAQGRQTYVDDLDRQITAHRMEGRIRRVGHVADMPAALALADLVLIASTEPEAFGRTSVEAQAMSVPVIATAIGAPPDTVLAPPGIAASSATGRHVPAGDARALADAIAELMSLSADERRAMGERARQHARRHFATRTLQHATLSIYDRLLGTGLAARFDGIANPIGTHDA